MNANIVSILSWSKPAKSGLVLLSINFILWILTRQRPFYVLPMIVLLWYGRQLWRHRIRSTVLIDPPDYEDWITLSTYDLQQATTTLLVDFLNQWLALRHTNHLLWTIMTALFWIIFAKLGMEMDFLTILFILSNAAFVVFPALEFFPKGEDRTNSSEQTQTINQTPPKPSTSRWRRQSTPPFEADDILPGPSPALVGTPSSTTVSPLYDFYEGIVTRSISAAAVSLMNSPGAVFNIGGGVSSHEEYDFALHDSTRLGPETLSPPIAEMPDIETVVDSDPEDEFLFDAKHFDKSSSSTSVSNSFEIIDDELL